MRKFSTEDCTPFKAPTAAHCEGAEGPEVCCDCTVAIASTNSLLDRPADAEAGHGVHLRHTVDDHKLGLLEGRLRVVIADGSALALKDQPVVNIIHNQVEAFLFAVLDYFSNKIFRIHYTRGIIRAINDDRLGIRAHSIGNLAHSGMEGAILGRDDHRDAARQFHHLRVTHPIGGRENDFILWVEDDVEQDHDSLLGSTRGDHIIRRDDFVVALLGVPNDGLLERGNAVGRRITDFAGMQDGGAADYGVDGRLALGLAASKVNHRLALLPEQRRRLIQFQSH